MSTETSETTEIVTSVKLIKPADRKPAQGQAGLIREEAIHTNDLWAGIARTAPGNRSGWHYHAGWDTVAYVITGALRLESGPGGGAVVHAQPGDYVFIPKGEVHSEGNPAVEEQTLVIVRIGSGPVVTNVDGPAPG